MAIQYPGGTVVSTTFIGATKQDIVSNLQTQLTNAGWTVVSGGGSTDVLMQSAVTPTANNSIQLRLRSTNLTNCCCLNLRDTAGAKVGQDMYLLPAAAKTFRVIANKYQVFCFTPGTSSGREFFAMGVPYIPSFLHGVVNGDFGWAMCNGAADGDSNIKSSFRTILGAYQDASHNYCGLVNGSLVTMNGFGSGSNIGGFRIVAAFPAFCNGLPGGYRWHDDSLIISDPLAAWGLTHINDEAKIRGQLWGAMILSDSYAADTQLSDVDGHNWHGITNTNNGQNGAHNRGTLFVATS